MNMAPKSKDWLLLFGIVTLLAVVCALLYIFTVPHLKTYKSEKLNVEFAYPSSWYLKDYVSTYGFIVVSPDPIQDDVYSESHIRIGLNKCTNTDTGETFPCEKSVTERVTFFKDIYPRTFRQITVMVRNKKMTQIEGGYPEESNRKYQKDTVFPDHSYLLVVSTGSREKKVIQIYNKLVKTVRVF